MRICKKFIVILMISLILIMSIIPSTANAALSDAQRQALVKVASQIVTEGNKNRVLRYSQDHRTSGFSWSKVRNHNKQSTVSNFNLTQGDQQRVLEALRADILKRYPRDEKMQKYAMSLSQLKSASYSSRTLGEDIYDTIAFDCSSFCSAVYDMTFGTKFIWTTYNFQKGSSGTFSVSTDVSSAKPGDVLWRQGHVAMYLGDYDNDGANEIAEAGGISAVSGDKKAEVSKVLADFLIEHPTYIKEHPNFNAKAGLPVVQLPEGAVRDATKQVVIRNINLSNSGFTHVYSYTGEVREGRVIDVSGTTTDNNGSTGGLTPGDVDDTGVVIGQGTSTIAYWPDNFRLEDQALANSEGYFHKGVPAYGGYTRIVSPLGLLIESAGDILDWLIGFITMALRIEMVGWTAIVENIVSNGLSFGTQNINSTDTTGAQSALNDFTGLPIETTNKITVEDVIFNNVPILDINFFQFDTAAGQQLDQNSIIYKIREVIAQWYYAMRIIVILLMLVILLYNIVKAMFTTIAVEKAEAKKVLVDWVVGFAVIFFIHYFMIGVISINNYVVDMFRPENSTIIKHEDSYGSITQSNEESLYEQIRIQAYDVSATTGWTGTFMYIAMVIYMCLFVFMYIKRLFILAILTVISPFIGALYAFNKKQYSLGTWGKEYIYNVIIQLIHAVIYTVVIAVALSMAKTSTIVGGILALILMAFMFPVEKMVKKIFKYDSKSLGGLGDSFAAQIAMYSTGKKVTQKLKNVTIAVTKESEDKLVSNNDFMNRMRNSKIGQTITDYEAKIMATGAMMGKTIRGEGTIFAKPAKGKGTKGNTGNISRAYSGNSNKTYSDYYEQYREELMLRNYKPSDELFKAIKKKNASQEKARKEFIQNRYRILTNSVIATAGLSLAIPMFMVNKENGMAALFFGAQSFNNAFKRKHIKGINRKGKKGIDVKNNDGTLKKIIYKGGKLLFISAASPILTDAYKNAWDNSLDEKEHYDKIQNKLERQMVDLQEAKKVEQQIVSKMKEMYEEREKHRPEESKLRERVNVAEKLALRNSLRTSLARFGKEDIQQVVSQYMKEKGIKRATLGDIREIQRRLNRELSDRDVQGIRVSDSLTDNIREELRKFTKLKPGVKNVTTDENGKEKVEVRARVEVRDIERLCREIAKEEKIENDVISDFIQELNKDREFKRIVEKQDIEEISNKIKVKLEDKLLDNEATEKMSESFKEKLDKKIEQKTLQEQKELNAKLESLKANQLVDLISDSLNSKGSIDINLKGSRYNELMKDVRRLDDINRDYYKLTGDAIYENVGNLIEKIRDGLVKD